MNNEDRRQLVDRREEELEAQIIEAKEELDRRSPGRRSLKQRRKLINDRNGYLNRNTKIPLYIAIACLVAFLAGLGLYFLHWNMSAAARWAQDMNNIKRVIIPAETWATLNLYEMTSKILLTIPSFLGVASVGAYFAIKGRNKNEFKYELAEVEEEIEVLEEELKKPKRYRQGDELVE
jgi:hypothetical protein